MPIKQVRKNEAISKLEFHQRLRDWLTTNEDRVGPEGSYKGAGWVFVRDGNAVFKLNTDTKRADVEAYLQFIEIYGDDLEWSVVENRDGNMTAVAYGPEKRKHVSFYLYAAGSD